MLISYALHAGLHGHGMDYLSETYLGHACIPIKSLIGSGKAARTFDRVPVEEAAPYAAEDAEVTWRLWRVLKPRLPFARVTRVYETLERPLVPVLAEMEMAGIRVDRARLSRLSGDFAQKMAGLEAEIHGLAGGKFNVGSPKQLGEVLFDQMGLEGGRKGKTGAYATGADVLEAVPVHAEHGSAQTVLLIRECFLMIRKIMPMALPLVLGACQTAQPSLLPDMALLMAPANPTQSIRNTHQHGVVT